jgi:hypothetical protein
MPRSAPCTIHPNVTIDRVMGATEDDDNLGICLYCGDDAYGVEPDAERYTCEGCQQPYVYGAEQLIVLGYYHEE